MTTIVLNSGDTDYSGMEKFGRVIIDYRALKGIQVVVDGFDFADSDSCRTHATKAMAWARDALDAAIKANMLVPGGRLSCAVGMDQEELDEERKQQ